MKKAFFLFAIIAALTACNNSSNGNNANNDSSNGIGTGPRSTDSDTAATEVQHVQNANGNMPDTTNSINIGTTTPNGKDSSKQH